MHDILEKLRAIQEKMKAIRKELERVTLTKTCSCGHRQSFDKARDKENEIGYWRDCPNCQSTLFWEKPDLNETIAEAIERKRMREQRRIFERKRRNNEQIRQLKKPKT